MRERHRRSRLLTYEDTADVLGVTVRTVYSLVKGGSLRVVRFGRLVRIDPRDLDEFITRSKSVAGGDEQ